MLAHARAILWAQFRILRNRYPRKAVAQVVLVAAIGAIWYGLWTGGAVLTGFLLAGTSERDLVAAMFPWGLLLVSVYWQVIPLLMLSTGAAIDLKQVLVYPIPKGQLFGIEVLLRLSTAFEMLIILIGATTGLILNPILPWWAPLGLVPFAAMNLLVSAGIRSFLSRILARKHIREVAVLFLVLSGSLPQIILLTGAQGKVESLVSSPPGFWWPWTAAGSIAAGRGGLGAWGILLIWTVAAYAFGRWQFDRVLRFDRDEAAAVSRPARGKRGWLDSLYRWPSAIFRDPLAVMVEKELRFLPRAPRFRLAFLMGFSFGLLVWLPMAIRGARSGSLMAENYLTFITVYALLLLAEVTFWNCFGFDRGAVQFYFIAGVPLPKVLIAKNIAAATVVLTEIVAITLVCMLLRMPVTTARIGESVAVTAVFTLYMLAIGNLGSSRYPRPTDPKQSWKNSSAARFQALLLLIYPLMAIPTGLAYLARWAFETDAAFYGTLAFDAALGAVFYWIALESAAATLAERREAMVAALGERGGPIAA